MLFPDMTQPVENIHQLAKKFLPKFQKLGIETVADLIFYYPTRHDDFSLVVPINQLVAGQTATVRGKIELLRNRRGWRRSLLVTEAMIRDDSGSVKAVWFGQYYLAKILQPGDEVFIAGRVDDDRGMVFYSPNYEKATVVKETTGTTHTGRLVPVYHLTKGLTSKQLRYLIKLVLAKVNQLDDYLPIEIKTNLKFIPLLTAVQQIHFPDNRAKLEQAQKRLKFDELFLIQLRNQLARRELRRSRAVPLAFKAAAVKELVAQLPFKLTVAQKKAAWEILKDLQRSYPMNRLLEGDVGSGKTVVTALALFNTAQNGYQAVLMAPTEILAQQHFNTLTRWLAKTGVKIGLVTQSQKKNNYPPSSAFGEAGKLKKISKKNKDGLAAQMVIAGSEIIIGTHALIQDKIRFKNLALAVVDEQHRFGVEQRRKLQAQSGDPATVPHFLSLTATPIPRSLALTLYGDLDLSLIDQLPAGRKPVITKIVQPTERAVTYEFIRQEIAAGRQAFVICPLIDPSDKLGVKSVKEEYDKLNNQIFPEITMGCLHGRLKSEVKEKVMADFLSGKIKILVSTSVVEVGVDVPNATVMMIEGAERFGLAQLHQFRGRVGRSEQQSHCFLLTDSEAEATTTRLQALVNSHDGFKLAEEDLRFRGPGEVFGTAQSGVPDLRLANLFDFALIKSAREWAAKIIQVDPQLVKYPKLKAKIGEIQQTHLE